MAIASANNGEFGNGAFLIHADSAHPNYVIVPDAHLLFSAAFSHVGPDLVLTGDDGRHHIIPGYFSSEHPPALMAPNGASLKADVVGLLAVYPPHEQYAQAQPTAPPDSIGKVEKVVGTVSVIRNGVSVALNVGDAVFKSDVIQTAADSKAGIAFPDGTALQLLANTRMALNEYSYDPNGHSNGALFTYVEGTFGFFAGKVAHTGDMKIDTPVATMGIRGTTGVMGQGKDATGNLTYWQALYDDLGTTYHGAWDDFRQNSDGTPYVAVTLSQTDFLTVFTLQGPGLPPLIDTVPLPSSYDLIAQEVLQGLADILAGTRSLGAPGSPENPFQPLPQEFLPEVPGNIPINYIGGFDGGSGNKGPGYIDTGPQQNPPPTFFIWEGGAGTWDTGSPWNTGFAPVNAFDTVEILAGVSQYSDNYTILHLIIEPGATLDVVGGTLIVLNGLDDSGTLLVGGDPPVVTIFGASTVKTGSKIEVRDGAVLDLFGNSVGNPAVIHNFGEIEARHGGDVTFLLAKVTNEAANADNTNPDITTPAGKIVSSGRHSVVDFTESVFDNWGRVVAENYGGVFFVDSAVTNEAGASIKAEHGGTITFAPAGDLPSVQGIIPAVKNYGSIDAKFGGEIKFEERVYNETGASIGAIGCDARVISTGAELDNFGLVTAAWGGTVELKDETVVNEASSTSHETTIPGGRIEAANWGAIDIRGGSVDNQSGAIIEARNHGSVTFSGTHADPLVVTNDAGAKIEAIDHGIVTFEGSHVNFTNSDLVEARDFGIVDFNGISNLANLDRIEARNHGAVDFEYVTAVNDGLIVAVGCGSSINLGDATINGGTLETRDGGIIQTIFGVSTFLNVTLDGAVVKVNHDTSLALDGGSSGIAAVIDKTVTFEGRGVVTMAYESYKLVAGDNGGTLVNDTTISGLGQIGVGDGALTFINHGTVRAHAIGPLHGNEFIIDTGIGFCGVPTTINTGLLEACGPCVTLLIEDTTLDNTCGTIAAFGPGAEADLVNSIIYGGTLATGDSCDPCFGIIEIVSPGSGGGNEVVFDGTGQKVTVDGFVQVQEGATLELKGTIDNKGTIDVDAPVGPGADLAIDGTVELRGGGVVTLDGPNDMITGVAHSHATLENYSTIKGEGSIGDGSKMLTLINEATGTIESTGGACDPLTIDTGDRTVVNDGLMTAGRYSVLDIESRLDNAGLVTAAHHGDVVIDANVHNEDGGKIEAEHGGTVTLDGIKVTNDAGARIEANGDCSVVNLSGSPVDNDGTLEAKNGGHVVIADSTIHNAGGTVASDGAGSVVDLSNVTIDDGNLDAHHGGLITVSGDSEFKDVTVSGNVEVASGTTLTLDDGTTASGGALTIDSGGTLDIEASTGATFDDVVVNNGGIINVDRLEDSSTIILTLDDGTTVAGGELSIGNKGEVDIESTSGATLDGVGVEMKGHGSIEVGTAGTSGAILTLDGGTTVSGGTLTIDANSQVNVEASGAAFDNVDVIDHGTIQVDELAAAALTLSGGTTINGACAGELLIKSSGTVDVRGSGATLDGVDVEMKGHGSIEVGAGTSGTILALDDGPAGASGTILTLDGGTTVSGGTLTIDANSQVNVEASGAAFDNVDVIDNGTIQVDELAAAALTLTGGTTIDGAGAGELLIKSSGTVDVRGSGATLDGVDVEMKGHGSIEVGAGTSGTILALDDGPAGASGTILTLDGGTTVSGGTLTIESGDQLDIEAGSTGDEGATLDDVFVNDNGNIQVDSGSLPSILTLDDGTTVAGGTLSVGHTGMLDIESKSGATLDNMEVHVASGGSVEIGAAGAATLTIEDTVKFKGGGVVTLDDQHARIFGSGDGATLDNFTTIAGQGKIGGDTLTFDNKSGGTVDADVAGKVLTLDTGSNPIGNAGLLESSAGGILKIKSDVDNIGGTIGAYDAGSLTKLFGVTITGGALATGDPYWLDLGVIAIVAAGCETTTIFDGSGSHPVTVEGFVQVDPGAQLELMGTIDNNGGTIDVDQGLFHGNPAGSDIAIYDNVTLSGFGAVALEGNCAGIVAAGHGATLNNESYIYGSRGGYIGTGDDALTFNNSGTVNSEAGDAGPLVLNTGCNWITNTGTLEATGGSELDIYSNVNNTGGTIAASAAASPGETFSSPTVVKLFDVTIRGGSLVTDDLTDGSGGMIEVVAGGASVFDGSGQKITVDGYVHLDPGASLELIGTISNEGTIDVDCGPAGSDLIIDGTVKLNGGGTVTLDGTSDEITGTNTGVLDNVNNTISGAGTIGNDGDGGLKLKNEAGGTIDVTGMFNLETGKTVFNAGFIDIAPSGSLDVQDAEINNLGANPTANSGAAGILISGAFLVGTEDAPLQLTGDGGVALDGGTIEGFGGLVVGDDSYTLENVNNDVTGNGKLGVGDDELFVQNDSGGTINANIAGKLLTIDTGDNAVINTGVLEATSGGVLVLDSDITNSDGKIATSGNNSTVQLVDVTIAGGTLKTGSLTSESGGVIEVVATDGGQTVFDGTAGHEVTINGYVNVDPGANLALAGSIDLLGTIDVDGVAGADLLIDNDVTLTGAGAVILDNHGDAIVSGTEGATLDNFSTISGQGTIGGESLSLVNDVGGVIDADIANRTLTVNTGEAITNKGTLEASNGGTLVIDDIVHNSGSGNVLIEGGVVDFAAAANVGEITFNNGTGTPAYGDVIFNDPNGLDATINGFTGTAHNLSHSDGIELAGTWTTVSSLTGSGGTLVVDLVDLTDGSETATLTFSDFSGKLHIGTAADGNTPITDPPAADASADTAAPATAEGTLSFADNSTGGDLSASVTPEGSGYVGNLSLGAVTESSGNASVDYGFSLGNDQIDLAPGQTVTQSYQVDLADAHNPAANATQTVSVSIGGPGNDNFVFAPGIGADTIVNFNPAQDTLELDHFANAQTVQQLQSLITADTHGNVFIDLGNHDSITLTGVTPAQLHAVLQSAVHLH